MAVNGVEIKISELNPLRYIQVNKIDYNYITSNFVNTLFTSPTNPFKYIQRFGIGDLARTQFCTIGEFTLGEEVWFLTAKLMNSVNEEVRTITVTEKTGSFNNGDLRVFEIEDELTGEGYYYVAIEFKHVLSGVTKIAQFASEPFIVEASANCLPKIVYTDSKNYPNYYLFFATGIVFQMRAEVLLNQLPKVDLINYRNNIDTTENLHRRFYYNYELITYRLAPVWIASKLKFALSLSNCYVNFEPFMLTADDDIELIEDGLNACTFKFKLNSNGDKLIINGDDLTGDETEFTKNFTNLECGGDLSIACPPFSPTCPSSDSAFEQWLSNNPTSGTNTGDQDLSGYLLKDTTLQTAETPTDTSLFSSWNGTSRVKSTLLSIWNVLKAKADLLYVSLTLRFEKHTGFYSANDPRNKKILVTYNGDKTVTLSRSDGVFQGYYEGLPIAGLTNGYTSPAISETTPTGLWFLYYNGTDIIWSQTPFLFSYCMITIAYFRTDGTFLFVVPETHGFMPESTHEELHKAIGAYGYSGNGVSGYTLNSTTATNRRPTFEAGVIADEDKHTDLLAMSSNYTRSWITSAGAITSDWNNAEIIPLNGNRPIINVITNGLGSQVDITNNNYCAVFVFKIAVGADSDSQRYRCVILQPQHQGTLTQMQAVNYTAVNINGLTGISNEIIFTQKIIVRYTGGNWSLYSVENISGNARFSVISSGATAGVNELNVSMDARTNLTGITLDANADIIDSYITNHKTWTTSGHTGTANTIAGFDGTGVAKEYKATIQSAISTSSGTIDLGVNTITVLTTTLTNSHTITVTPTAPTEFINSQIAQLDFTTGVTTPSITLTAPSGVTFKWRHAEITAWTASKTYTIQFVWISSTRCDIYYLIS